MAATFATASASVSLTTQYRVVDALRHFDARVCHAALDVGLGSEPAKAETPLQFVPGGRQDEDCHGVWHQRADRGGALHVDVHDHAALALRRSSIRARGVPVPVIVHLRRFEKTALRAKALEFLDREEVVVHAIALAGAGGAGGGGDAARGRGGIGGVGMQDGVFADAGGAGDDEEDAAAP